MIKTFTDGVKDVIDTWCLDLEKKYIQRHRKVTGMDFLNYMVSLTSSDFGYCSAIIQSGGPIISKSSFCQFRNKVPYTELLKLCTMTLDLIKKLDILPHNRILAVDGSKILADHSLEDCGYKSQTKVGYSQGQINTVLEISTGIPIDIEFVPNKNERDYIRDNCIRLFKKGDIIVADRGYYSFELVKRLIDEGINPVFRMSASCDCTKKFLKAGTTDQVMMIGDGKGKKGQLNLRMVKYVINGENYCLGTTLFDTTKYSVSKLKEMYHLRWGIEEHYKFLKHTCGFSKRHSKSENGIRQELYVDFFLILITRAIESIESKMLKTAAKKKKKFNSRVIYHAVKTNVKDILLCKTTKMCDLVVSVLSRHMITFERDRSYDRFIKEPTTKEKYNDLFSKRKRGIIRTSHKTSKPK